MELILKILTVVLLSAVKYLFGVSAAIAFGFNYFQILILTVSGGMLGVVVYLYLWELILHIKNRFRPKKNKPIKFTPMKRKLVRFIKKYEVWGIAFLTPIITPPIGTILASSIEHNKWRIKLLMFLSFTFWTIIFLVFNFLYKIYLGSSV